jgi:S-disulfanyl-L-cysteine oxidoreductase SoxD
VAGPQAKQWPSSLASRFSAAWHCISQTTLRTFVVESRRDPNDQATPPAILPLKAPFMLGKPVILVTTIAAVLAIAGGAWWYSTQQSGENGAPPAIDANDAALVTLGRQVYQAQCAACHGENLQGEPNWKQRKPSGRMPAPPHDASGHTWHHADDLLFNLTKFGIAKVSGRPVETDMPVFDGTLSDREIAASLAYIKSTWPLEIRKRHAAMSARQQ